MTNGHEIRAALADAPRVELGFWPTPLQPCHRLRSTVGGPLVWLKRDDCSGLATGGNKTRKLEFLLADARSRGATGVVTFGALQSNHARQTAAACAALGLVCHLVLTSAVDRDDVHYRRSGNLLLDDVLGATVHVVADAEAAAHRAAELLGDDAALHVVEPGGSNPVGTLGYVAAAAELLDDLGIRSLAPAAIVVGSSTGGTAAGLCLGLALAGSSVPVVAAAVYEVATPTLGSIDTLVTRAAPRLGLDPTAVRRPSVDDRCLGAGYGIETPASRRAIEVLARAEGVLLDPVYTAKAFALVLDGIEAGVWHQGEDVVFVHTGGQAGLFAYADGW